jgi:AraC family transcriptional regulator
MATQATTRIEPRIVHQAGLLLAGLSQRYTLDCRSEIPRQWALFAPQIADAPERIGEETFGAISFVDGGFDYLTAVRVWDASALPKGWTRQRVAPGRIAAFTHDGPLDTLAQTLDAVHAWVPWVDARVGGAPQLLEVYGPDFDPVTGRGSIEVRLALAD